MQWKSKSFIQKKQEKVATDSRVVSRIAEPLLSIQNNSPIILASKENLYCLPFKIILNKDSVREQVCGDSLFLENGKALKVKILEISNTEIKYKRCADGNKSLVTINKSTVKKIKYGNGTVEDFVKAKPTAAKPNKEGKPSAKSANSALIGAMLFLLGGVFVWLGLINGLIILLYFGFVLGAIACVATIILASLALMKIRQDPEHHTGLGRAWFSLAISTFFGVLGLLALLFLLAWII